MKEFLVFRLYGAMASWGDVAVGEVRPSASHPSRSAIMGLLSAALGIKRSEQERLNPLFNGYDVAAKVVKTGTIMKDYHTVQVPDSSGKTVYATRRDELVVGKDRVGTALTSREYRCDAVSIVSICCREDAPYTLAQLQAAITRPRFVLYLGRKSCPVSTPLSPQVVLADSFIESLDNAIFPPFVTSHAGEDISHWYLKPSRPRYYWEGEAEGAQQSVERYDDPTNRERWQFAPRIEHSMSKGGDT